MRRRREEKGEGQYVPPLFSSTADECADAEYGSVLSVQNVAGSRATRAQKKCTGRAGLCRFVLGEQATSHG